MRAFEALAVISLAALCPLPAVAQRAAVFDELTQLFPDTDITSAGTHIAVDMPRGVPAGVHALITGLPGGAVVRCGLTENGTAIPDARIYRLIDVPVEQNTGLVSRTEAWDGKDNPHVIRPAPFRIFEVLEPIDGAAHANEGGLLGLRVELPIPPGAKVGPRAFVIELDADDWHASLRWGLRVHAVTVPPVGPRSLGYTNWFSPDIIAQRHGVDLWSEPFWELLGRYGDLMARGRQDTFWIRWRDFASVNQRKELALDRARLTRYIRLFLDRGFTRIEGGHLAYRHEGDWSSPRLDLGLTGADVNSAQGQADLGMLLSDLRTALAEVGLPERVQYLQHLSDEPTDTNAESYQALAEQVRQHMPGVKIFEATMSLKLVGAVDCWCPQVQEYQKHPEFFEARKRAGDEVWVYTCLAPGGPWLNRLLDQERLRQVYLGWALVKYDLAGFLHWGLNHYRPGVDPFTQSVVPHGQGPPNYLPAGDSHVVYPGPDGPLPGQRFEAQRIGMEDGELLRFLIARDPARARAIIARVFRAFDDYETDLGTYRAAKLDLLTALSRTTED